VGGTARESMADNRMFAPLLIQSIENTNKDIDKVFADCGYDSYINFEICEEAGIEPVIMVRRNSAMQLLPKAFVTAGERFTELGISMQGNSFRI